MAAMNDSLKASVIQKQSKLFFPVEIAVKVILITRIKTHMKIIDVFCQVFG